MPIVPPVLAVVPPVAWFPPVAWLPPVLRVLPPVPSVFPPVPKSLPPVPAKLPPVPASEILIRLDKGKQVQVGETTVSSEGADNGRQRFRVAVGRGGLVPLVISERSSGGNRSPLVLVNSRSTGRIEPAGLRWEVVLDLDVYARATDTFRLQVPGSVDLAEVEAPELGQWTARSQADGTAKCEAGAT